MTSLKLNLGGAPSGPAGAGKTETVKDLAKKIGKKCVVINCSDQMDYLAIGTIFKGVALTGSWVCFDEFNRVDIEVLSSVSEQIKSLLDAKAQGKAHSHFEGSEIKVNKNFGIFVTMNPGYAGRTELPDNLRGLFQPIPMVIPDYMMISEIKLYLSGVDNCYKFAKKTI